ncbi:flagellar assembly protein FliW [Collibacillus ludicampi]|uniref:Flagellar assembly factor FliW n=1 Tax=Collibacillus ludicampi TaxID=2771369 RepID=A0AAV4LCC6_9BACL|nr:flagellar assembly protein FliW [Collibacillus ludicampi]GIM45502.1 flagellar assembly protein FliW [Collibacillus ludicampi]
MLIHTTRFGNLEVGDQQVLTFPKGLPGFEDLKRYVMIELEEYQPFLFMQSLEDPDLTFILMDPYPYVSDYPNRDTIRKEAGWDTVETGHILVRVIATIARNGVITLNLLAPILIHTRNNTGEQVILHAFNHLSFRYPLVMTCLKESTEVQGSCSY